MRIDSIEIQNYRCFESYRAALDPRLTLLVGPNGSGKSSLLAAARRGLEGLLHPVWIEGGIADDELRRRTSTDLAALGWSEIEWPCSISLLLRNTDGGESRSLLRRDRDRPSARGDSGHPDLPDPSSWLQPPPGRAVPLFACIGAQPGKPTKGRVVPTSHPFESRAAVYQSSASAEIDSLSLVQWFQHNELRTLQEGRPPDAYAAARAVVLKAIHALDIRYVVKDSQLMLLHESEGWRAFDWLSDGQKRIASIFCELALRCATLNAHLAERCVVDTPGVVTIDELDLHLHPKWQRSLIGDLCRTFPKLQFLASSHSPFLLQAAFDHGKVLDVGKGQFVEPGDPSIEDIAEAVMGVPQPQRSQRFNDLKHKAQRFYELLESQPVDPAERQRLQAELDAAMAPFANDPAAAAWLEQRREAAGH